jgi:hypothetical protein
MVRKVARSLAICIVIAMTQTSCFEEVGVSNESNFSEMMVLGERLNNPFTVDNMELAIASLKKSDPESYAELPDELRPTHYYVRFLPKDETQLEVLLSDSTLSCSDYPLDYEVDREGTFYHDPELSSNDFTYLYSAIPVDHKVPNEIEMEVLDELFLPSAAVKSVEGRSSADENYSDAIEEEAFRLAGISEEASHQTSSARQPSKWTPSGRVTVWDNRLNVFVPLAGVKVEARRWFDIKQAVTDSSGYYKMDGSFRHEAHYRLLFERSQFDIRSGTFGQAKINGPKKRGDWNIEIKSKTIEFHYAHVFRAAMRYYYGDIGGLMRPSFRLKYSVFDKGGNHAARNIGNWSVFGINPNVLIYRYAPDRNEYDADEIFSNACHETAHTTHMQSMSAGAIQFLQVSEAIRESWAVGVEWFITQKEYKEKGILNYGDPGYRVPVNYPAFHAFQYWSRTRGQTLTSLFIDIVDNNNQRGQTFGYGQVGVVNDAVSGYTFAEIEKNILKDVYGFGSLNEALKTNKPVQLTNQQIDLLLDYFN